MERSETPDIARVIAYVLVDVGEISRIIVEECGASMMQAVIATDRILEYLEGKQ